MTSWGNFSHQMYKSSWYWRCSPYRCRWERRGSHRGQQGRWKRPSGRLLIVQLHWIAKRCPSTQNWIFSSSPSRHVSAAPLSLFIASMENCLDLAIRTGGAAGSDAPTQTLIRLFRLTGWRLTPLFINLTHACGCIVLEKGCQPVRAVSLYLLYCD